MKLTSQPCIYCCQIAKVSFPSVSTAWNLSEEKFIKSLNVIDNLKLRASWGKSGNQDISSFGNYDYIPLVSIGGTYPIGSPNAGLTGDTSSIASTSRTWETIESKNIGLDFTFLKDRLRGSFDYFIKENKNMLVSSQVPATLGGTPPSQNLGHLITRGWELSLSWKDKIGDFNYSITGGLSDSKNKLIELKGNDVYTEGLNFAHQGYSLYTYFGYVYDGIIQNADQLAKYKTLGGVPANIGIGDVMYKDIDGDGQITAYGDPNIAPYSGADWQARTDASGFLIAEPASARIFDPGKHYLRPLPTLEIALYAGKLEQNPGW